MKRLLIIVMATCTVQSLAAQIGKSNDLGLSAVAQSPALGLSDLPRCSEVSSCSTTEYIFTGNGLWTTATNWRDGIVPPPVLLPGKLIIISPITGGECKLNIKQTISHGATLTIVSSKRLIVGNNLVFLKN